MKFFAVSTVGSYIYYDAKGFIEVIPSHSATYPALKKQKCYLTKGSASKVTLSL